MKSNNEQIKKYYNHLTFFAAEATPLCASFLKLLEASPEAHLECSYKKVGIKVHPLRFNLWYKNNGEFNLNPPIITFLENNSQDFSLNFSLYQQIFNLDFQYDKVKSTCVGIDARKQLSESRVKLWYIIEHYPEKEAMLLDFSEISPLARILNIQPRLLFGFDFELDGKTALKVYPALNALQIQQASSLLSLIFGTQTLELFKQCERVYFGFTTKEEKISLHLVPRNPKTFIDNFNNPILSDAYHFSGAQRVIISLDSEEAEKGCYFNFNMYY